MAEENDAIASFLWSSPTGAPRPTERLETVLSPKAVSQLVGGLTEKLKLLEEAKGLEERRRQSLLAELSDTRTQLALTRSQLLRLEGLAALFVVARLLTSSSMVSAHVPTNVASNVATMVESTGSFCVDVMAWFMVWLGGCSLVEGLVGVALVSQLVYLLLLDDVDPFANHASNQNDKKHHSENDKTQKTDKNGASLSHSSSVATPRNGVPNDDLKHFIPKDAPSALEAMNDSSDLWTQPPTFQDKSTGLAVWHRPLGSAVHEFKFTVDINSEPAPVFAVAREVELMSTWNPFISSGVTLHYTPPPDGSIRAYLQIQLPWPLPKFAVVVSGKLFDCLDSKAQKDKCLVVALGSEKEQGAPPPGLMPPTTPHEVRRLWVRVIAKAMPVRTCPKNTPLTVTAGGSADGTPEKIGWFSTGQPDSTNGPKTKFEVIAKIKFPIPSPGWVIRFIISTLAPLVVTKVQQLLPSLMTQDKDSEHTFPHKMSKDRALYGSLLTDKVRRTVPP